MNSNFNYYDSPPSYEGEGYLPDIGELLVNFMADPIEQKKMDELANKINNVTIGSLTDLQQYTSFYEENIYGD